MTYPNIEIISKQKDVKNIPKLKELEDSERYDFKISSKEDILYPL